MTELSLDLEMVGAVVSHTLEEAAYLVTEPVSDQLPCWPARSLLQARLRLAGRGFSGELVLICSARLAVEIAANMMGIEPSTEQAVGAAEDALGEVLNMVAGSLCEQWCAEEPGIEVAIPQVEVTTDQLVDSWIDGRPVVALRTDDDDWLLATVQLDE